MLRSVTLGLVCLLTVSTGCASIMSGTTQKVQVETDPEATMTVDGRTYSGPAAVDLRRGQSHVLRVERPGFESRNVSLTPKMNGWVWGNLALGPLFPIGILVDAISGAINNVTPNRVHVALDPKPEAPRGPERFERPPAHVEPTPAPRKSEEAEDDIHARAENLNRALEIPPDPKLAPAYASWVVAVMEVERLRGDPRTDEVTQALTEQFRILLAERGLRVVNRGAQEEAMDQLLLEEKKKSYRECAEATCQIPLGRAVAASHVLRATIGRFGQRCVVNGELIELERELTVGASAVPGDCTEEALLEGVRVLSNRLLSP